MLVIRWYQEAAKLKQCYTEHDEHQEQNLYTSCRLLLYIYSFFKYPNSKSTARPLLPR